MPTTTEALPFPELLDFETGDSGSLEPAVEVGTPAKPGLSDSENGDFRIQILGSLGSGKYESQARAINDYGQIAGYSAGHEQIETSVIVADMVNGLTNLGNLGKGCAEAWDINNRGQIVGQVGLGQTSKAFFASNGTIEEVRFTGVEYLARAINDRGVIAGSLKQAKDGVRVGFVLDAGTIHKIQGPDPSSQSTEVFDINIHGEAVGSTQTPLGRSAFRWTQEGGMTLLPSIGGESVAYSINDSGVIAGGCRDKQAHYSAVLWRNDLVIPCANGDYYNSLFFGLNEKEEAVGMMIAEQSGRWRAAYWNGERLVALPDQFGWMNWASDINNRGMICGTAFVPHISIFQAALWYRY